jgi:hypothetical protein
METNASSETAPTDAQDIARLASPPPEEDGSLTTFPYSRFMALMHGEITPDMYADEVEEHVESQLPTLPLSGATAARS